MRRVIEYIANEALVIATFVGGLVVVITGDPDAGEQAAEVIVSGIALLAALIVRGGINGPMTRKQLRGLAQERADSRAAEEFGPGSVHGNDGP